MNNPHLIEGCCDVCVAVVCFCFYTFSITLCSFLSLTGRWRRLIGIPVWKHTWMQFHNCGGLYTSCSHQPVKYLDGRSFSCLLLDHLEISCNVIELNSSLKTSPSFCLGIHLLSVTHTALHCVKTVSFWMCKWCRQPGWCWSSLSPAYRGWQVQARSHPEENKTTHH